MTGFERWRRRPLLVAGLALLGLAAAILLAYSLIGSSVDENGWLHEPFAAIPLSWFFGVAGAALIAIAVWRDRRGRGRDDLNPSAGDPQDMARD